jgi:hypothetical protein
MISFCKYICEKIFTKVMEVSLIKKVIDKNPRQIIKEVAHVSDALISNVLNGKVEDTRSSRLVKKISTDLAIGMMDLEEKIKEKYSIIM